MCSQKLLLVGVCSVGDHDVGTQRKDVGVWQLWVTIQSMLVHPCVPNYVLNLNYIGISTLSTRWCLNLLGSHVRKLAARNVSSQAGHKYSA